MAIVVGLSPSAGLEHAEGFVLAPLLVEPLGATLVDAAEVLLDARLAPVAALGLEAMARWSKRR